MRARLAIASSGIQVELREVVLRNKPEVFLETSPSGTVPCLKAESQIIDESFDIMIWALSQNDPEHWLSMAEEENTLITECDSSFKSALDRYKYSVRYENVDAYTERENAAQFIHALNARLRHSTYLLGDLPTLADMAILPFIRQYAHVNLEWFSAQPWVQVSDWLEAFKTSERFTEIMRKYPAWYPDQAPVTFPN
jgi:glutathione S-transferase